MIVIKLRNVMADYEDRTGEKLTYSELAARAGLARATVEALGSRRGYNPTLATVDRLCEVLDCGVEDLLEYVPNADV